MKSINVRRMPPIHTKYKTWMLIESKIDIKDA